MRNSADPAGSIDLSWSYNADRSKPYNEITGFNIYEYNDDSEKYEKITDTPIGADTMNYTVTGLEPKTSHPLVVTAVSESTGHDSLFSKPVTVKTAAKRFNFSYSAPEHATAVFQLANGVRIAPGRTAELDK